jgi:isopropylmalate/homocitrate/citramalate synthase
MQVTICDVSPRDGLQNEPEALPALTRAELVSQLAAAGPPRVEAASFVRAEAVRQIADAEAVVAAIDRRAFRTAATQVPAHAPVRQVDLVVAGLPSSRRRRESRAGRPKSSRSSRPRPFLHCA